MNWLYRIIQFFDCRFARQLDTIKTGREAYQKLSRRQAQAWEAGARAGIAVGVKNGMKDFGPCSCNVCTTGKP